MRTFGDRHLKNRLCMRRCSLSPGTNLDQLEVLANLSPIRLPWGADKILEQGMSHVLRLIANVSFDRGNVYSGFHAFPIFKGEMKALTICEYNLKSL